MDQPQDTDSKASQELISQLTKEVANLRDENAQLQSQLSGGDDGAPRSYDDLLEEIDGLKAELEERPTQEEVDVMEEKIQKHRLLKKEWRQSTEYLFTQMDEAKAARDEEDEGLEQEIEELKEKVRQKEKALEQLQSQRPDDFNIYEFLRGGLGKLPPKPKPVTVTTAEGRRIKAVDKHVFPAKEAGAIKWADKGGRFVVSLPSVIYNGQTQLTEPYRGNIVTGSSYGVFRGEKSDVYYGTYRCIKKVPIDWDTLVSFGQEFVASFFDRVMVERDSGSPAIVSLVQHLYKTGSLKAECLAFECEDSVRPPKSGLLSG